MFRDVLNDETDPTFESFVNKDDKDSVRFCVLGIAHSIAELSKAVAAGKISVVAGSDGEISNKKLSGITIEQGNNGRFRFCEKNETTGLGRDYPWPSLKVVSGQVVSEFPNPFKSLVNSTVAGRVPDEDADIPSESIFDRKWVSLVDSVRFLSATKNVDFNKVLHSLLIKLQDEKLEIEGVSLKDGKDAGPHELITRGYWSNCTTDWNDQFAGYKLTGYPVDGEIQVVLLKQDQTLAFKKLQVKSVDFCSHFLESAAHTAEKVAKKSNNPGRPPKWNWPLIRQWAFEFWGHNGLPNVTVVPGDSNEPLVTHLLVKCQNQFGDEPGVSTIRGKLKNWRIEFEAEQNS